MKKILILAGPTAVGKTEYALELAERFRGEIVSSDSMQLYRYMDIGSAKPTAEELARVKHYLIGEIDPRENFSAAKYEKRAKEAIEKIFQKNKLPIVSGGTGLYINSLIYEMDFGAAPAQKEYRENLEREAAEKGGQFLHDKLSRLDPASAERIHPNNVRKLIRALEAAELSSQNIEDFSKLNRRTSDYEVILIGLTRDRSELYDRINKRVDILMEKGLLDEIKELLNMGLTEDNISMKGIGYKELIGYFHGKYSLEKAVELIKRNTRHYAKRQMTWFKRYEDMKWFSLSEHITKKDALTDMISWIEKKL